VALHARALVRAYGRARCSTTMQQMRTIVTPPFLLPTSNCTTKVVIGAINIGVYPNDRAFFAAGGPVSATATQHILRLLRLDISAFNASSTTSPQQQVGRHQVLWPRVRGRVQRAIDETNSRSPLDNNGHCMHTTHLVHGTRLCRAATFFDYAKGTSTTIGMVPRASIATYKAW
jgi:hypothetical protein